MPLSLHPGFCWAYPPQVLRFVWSLWYYSISVNFCFLYPTAHFLLIPWSISYPSSQVLFLYHTESVTGHSQKSVLSAIKMFNYLRGSFPNHLDQGLAWYYIINPSLRRLYWEGQEYKASLDNIVRFYFWKITWVKVMFFQSFKQKSVFKKWRQNSIDEGQLVAMAIVIPH